MFPVDESAWLYTLCTRVAREIIVKNGCPAS